jgi:hypothetical protein
VVVKSKLHQVSWAMNLSLLVSGEVFVSAVAWMLVESGVFQGVQKGGALANYRLDGIRVPLEIPPPSMY